MKEIKNINTTKIRTLRCVKSKREAIIEYAMLLLLLLSAMNAFNQLYVFLFGALIFCLFSIDRKKNIPLEFWCLFIFGVAYIVFVPLFNHGITTIIKFILPAITFLLGYWHVSKCNQNNGDSIIRIVECIVVISIGLLMHIVLNLINNINTSGRNPIDIWTGQIASATGQAVLACFCVGICIAVLFSPNHILYKLLCVLALIIVLYYNLMLAGRTLILLLALTTVIAFSYMLFTIPSKKWKIRVIIGGSSFIVCVLLVLLFDIFGIRTLIIESNLFQRFFGDNKVIDVGQDPRLSNKLQYISLMFKYPFGGGKIFGVVQDYAHDLYLDSLSEAGIFALIAVVVFIVLSLKTCFSCLIN
ncbi:MAG: hypothetical protein IJ393_06160, partial [Clostridia bacterium]|nr:hypothetical protein [Clostridia bacterium]